jgi:nicotinamide riboside transporter PnuC
MYVTLLSAAMLLAEKRSLFWCATSVAAVSMALMLVSHLYTVPALFIANSLILAIFFGLVSVSLFAYLGERGRISSGRLYASVSLYCLLGLTWFALYSFLSAVQPGSFAESGIVLTSRPAPSKILYFSLTTLTTLGYGDIVAVKPEARMLAALESVAGVLYIAITVARLVAAYQTPDHSTTAQTSAGKEREE